MSTPARASTRGPRSRLLLLLTSAYGALYLALMLAGQYGTAGAEPTVVKILFLVFLAGYGVVWFHEAAGGAVFVLWWLGMWYLGLFVARQDRGAGVVLGLPLAALGVLFLVRWSKRHGRERLDS